MALYRYRGLLREFVLRVKVHSDHRALELLGTVFTHDLAARRMIKQADYIVIAPSSLWGRIRGRLDLAALLAAELGFGDRQIATPWHLCWRWHKHARLQREERPALPEPGALARRLKQCWQKRFLPEPGCSVLVIDDVMTSGATMASLFACFPGCRVRGLVLARA